MFGRKTRAGAGPLAPAAAPRDVEALEAVLAAFEQASTEAEVYRAMVRTITDTFGLDYGAVWRPGPDGRFVVAEEFGRGVAALASSRGTSLGPGDGWGGKAIGEREHVHLTPDSAGTPCRRWQDAQAGGAVEGALFPSIDCGEVTALVEYYHSAPLPFFGQRAGKWESIDRVLASARHSVRTRAELAETLSDREAVTTVVTSLSEARDRDQALRVALDTVREAFGWAYGSFWALDESDRTLRFAVESGSAGDEFRRVTLAASFAEGVGLSGRAWRARDLVFVRDLAEVTDCVRAPAAQRAGVKSGVCFPITVGGHVVGTMDFFVTEFVDLSETRAAALRNVAQLVSQRLDVLHRAEVDAQNSRELLDTVSRLRDAVLDAGRVGDSAAGQASALTGEVQALAQASQAVGEVIKIISGIADQTNLLALNATIEAARAGELGRGFAVVASEVKDLARETADATQRVAQQIAGIQASSEQVTAGIEGTTAIIRELDAVQARIGAVLDEQVRMATAFEDR
ncbi:methyl-accepting chemotaxis protein [Kineococcus sp. TRM81007]|uniref:methyl-accepting chemotaxis protein n=1 Tax=Kineococcus sp. TRM81007 TaxID=2925831 RepID=UPI0027E255FB|nr:methyl-accepting chemotaxis protein [Kineococcus sp. TRM81007]